MAALAHSTRAPVVRGGPVTQAVAIMRRAQPEPDWDEGLGCIVIDGEPVFFTAGRMPEPGGLAVVIHLDGRFAVEPVPRQDYRPFETLGRALIFIARPGPHMRGILEVRDAVTLVGAVR